MPLCHCIELPAKRFPLQMEFPSAGHEKKPFSMKMRTDPRKKQLLQMLGLLTLFFINNPQDLAYLLSTLEGKGYKAYNDILGENLISYNIIIIWGPQGRTHADQGHMLGSFDMNFLSLKWIRVQRKSFLKLAIQASWS